MTNPSDQRERKADRKQVELRRGARQHAQRDVGNQQGATIGSASISPEEKNDRAGVARFDQVAAARQMAHQQEWR